MLCGQSRISSGLDVHAEVEASLPQAILGKLLACGALPFSLLSSVMAFIALIDYSVPFI